MVHPQELTQVFPKVTLTEIPSLHMVKIRQLKKSRTVSNRNTVLQ